MTPFLIVGTFRSGSSALAELLGLHPQITCGWESTEHAYGARRIRLAEEFFVGNFTHLRSSERAFLVERHQANAKAIGFRLLFRSTSKWLVHPRFSPVHFLEGLDRHLRWLAGRTDVRIIHLVRKDNFEWLRSIALARATQLYFGVKYPRDFSIDWDLREALKRVQMKHYLGQRFSELESSHCYIKVSYEDFRADNTAVVALIVDFLDCDPSTKLSSAPSAAIQSDESHKVRNAEALIQRLEREHLRFE